MKKLRRVQGPPSQGKLNKPLCFGLVLPKTLHLTARERAVIIILCMLKNPRLYLVSQKYVLPPNYKVLFSHQVVS